MSSPQFPTPVVPGVPDGPADPQRTDADFERRWSAWQARGKAHERAVHRRLFILAPAAAVAAAIGYLLVAWPKQ
jgi:hypothetical protein